MATADQQIISETMSPEEYKQACLAIKRYQNKKGRKPRRKPILAPIGKVSVVEKKFKVQQSPVDWDTLRTGMPFSLDEDATVLYTKTGKERACCLNTMQPVPVGGASVYRVFL